MNSPNEIEVSEICLIKSNRTEPNHTKSNKIRSISIYRTLVLHIVIQSCIKYDTNGCTGLKMIEKKSVTALTQSFKDVIFNYRSTNVLQSKQADEGKIPKFDFWSIVLKTVYYLSDYIVFFLHFFSFKCLFQLFG